MSFLILTTISLIILHFSGIIKFETAANYPAIIIIASVLLIYAVISGLLIAKNISSGLKKLKFSLKNFFAEKNITDNLRENIKREDDFKEIFKEIADLRNTYKLYTDFAQDLLAGNYKTEIKISSEKPLGSALEGIKESLLTAEKKEAYNVRELKRNNWYQNGVTDFTLLLQQDYKDTEEMSYPVIKKLAEHTEVEQAGIFILKKKKDKEILHLEAAYAYDKKKLLDTETEIGEGLVGKCAKQQKMMRIDDLPEGYTYIGSGLGEDTPKSLLLMPLIYEKKLLGVLEIASLKKIPDYKINFLNVIAERIAAEIHNINTKKLTEKLAEDYKKQSEELAEKEKQSEEKISQLTKEKQNLKNKIAEIDENIARIFITSDGKIINVNKAAEEIYKIKQADIIGKPLNTFTKNQTDFSEILQKILKNQTISLKYTRNNNKEEITEKYIPVKSENEKIEKILLISILTEIK